MTATLAGVPTFDAFMAPIIQRLRARGGSMTIAEMEDDVPAAMGLSDDIRAVVHGKWQENAVEARLGWARSWLKKIGAVDNSARGVWSLTPLGAALTDAELAELKARVRQAAAADRATRRPSKPEGSAPLEDAGPEAPDAGDWKARFLAALGAMDPSAFERLCQRLLRESGFVRVEVTGKTGDGGIDGTGVLRVNLLSFQVLFQCKRWKGSVGASTVRDFRGAMVGRTDKGLILTTGAFTADARREATRDGALAIDLVDGDLLCDLLKDKGLGVRVRMVEEVTVDEPAIAAF